MSAGDAGRQAPPGGVEAVLAEVALLHSAEPYKNLPLLACPCGREHLTVTEHARHVAAEQAAALAPVLAAERAAGAREALEAAAAGPIPLGVMNVKAWLRQRAIQAREDA